MARATQEYPGRLVMPPDQSIPEVDVVEIAGASPSAWSVNIPLWTAEEGRSDLTLQVTMRDSAEDLLDVEIDDIHVL
jgi:hypothetical protein